MSFLLQKLSSKQDIDEAIKSTEDVVLVLRFGRDSDTTCLKLDDILAKAESDVSLFAKIYTVDVESVPVYTQYFDISLIPATVFFFNGHHIKTDWGRPDHTKFIGSFMTKQDFIDSVEVIYRGAMKGKLIVRSPLDPSRVPNYELIYKDI